MTLSMERMTGYLRLGRLDRGMTPWFATAGREFGLWFVTLHGFGFEFSVIGPFKLRRR